LGGEALEWLKSYLITENQCEKSAEQKAYLIKEYDIYTCTTLYRLKSDADRLYTEGDKVTHMETGPGKFSAFDRNERVRFHGLVAVTSAGLLPPFQTLYNEPFLSRTDAIASGFRFSKTESYSSK
jgi:hypothetical protein